MKTRIVKEQEEKFQPITVEITFESRDEVKALWAQLSLSFGQTLGPDHDDITDPIFNMLNDILFEL